MPVVMTLSVNLAESVSLRELRQFVDMAERNGADLDADLREYDDNNELVGLAAVGKLDSDTDDESDLDDEGDVDEEEGDVDEEEGDVDEDAGATDEPDQA
jgi:hypothetical protein